MHAWSGSSIGLVQKFHIEVCKGTLCAKALEGSSLIPSPSVWAEKERKKGLVLMVYACARFSILSREYMGVVSKWLLVF